MGGPETAADLGCARYWGAGDVLVGAAVAATTGWGAVPVRGGADGGWLRTAADDPAAPALVPELGFDGVGVDDDGLVGDGVEAAGLVAGLPCVCPAAAPVLGETGLAADGFGLAGFAPELDPDPAGVAGVEAGPLVASEPGFADDGLGLAPSESFGGVRSLLTDNAPSSHSSSLIG